MRTYVEPALHAWAVGNPSADVAADRAAIARRVAEHADRLGTGKLSDPPGRIIGTGHQAWLWHPGILAKDLAMMAACRRFNASPLHLIVDQDAHEALTLELPRKVGRRIETRSLRLASHRSDVPTGEQPAADAAAVRRVLMEADDERLVPIIEAFEGLPNCRTLAEQLAVVTVRLMRPWLGGDVPVLFVSDLADVPGYAKLIQQMVADAWRCVRAYNTAVRRTFGAGLTELTAMRELVELPVWSVQWGRPRGRVFVDLGDSTPMLVDERGEPINREAVRLLPRALLLTAVMRSIGCDVFIHGKGGGVYDLAMERWWESWQGGPLAPRAVVSADVYLPFDDVPVAGQDELAKAVWFRHYVPHNVDRVLGVDGPTVRAKRDLLREMDRDRNRKRRRHAFERLHATNDQLLAEHPALLARADQRLADARQGVINAQLTGRRDWCFALYPPARLSELRSALSS
ncbi:hypothetical protein ACERK3_05320 [Phycisphaerales bacterium AB-hyl4]|uniref:Uncharacterized protein n=1 Tax=Natronomicrosphaera hydrolytica TaxID=3242702 RepID=A0ABV4U2Z4_9BACT